jgi:tetratricopeptide (TPR) repeat protein
MSNAPEKPFGEVEANLEKAGRVEELIRLYESRSREVPEADEAAHLLCRAADLARGRLKNPVRAEELLRRALVYRPGSRESLEGLRSIYEQRNDVAALADTLEKLAVATPGADACRLYLRAGELHETKLGRRDRAVICYQLGARAAPMERQAYERARHILLAEGRYASAFESLERERAALGERELVEDYVSFAEALVNHPSEHALATRALVRALAADGKHARAHAVQKALSKLEYVWRETVRQLKGRSLEERDRRMAARQSLQIARLYSFYEPGAVDKVKEAIDRCFALWPAMPDALDLLEQVAGKMGDMRAALTIFSKLANETRDRSAKVDLGLRIGQILLSKLNDPVEAAAAFEEAAKLDPTRPDAAELASEQLISLGRGADAVQVLERHLATVKDRSAQVAMRFNLADLCVRVLKDPLAARAHLEAAARTDPNNAQVAWRLVSALAEEGQLEALWPMLELAVSAPRPISERVSLCERVARLGEAANDSLRAFEALSMALPLDPARGPLLPALTEAAKRAGQESRLAVSLRRSVQVAPARAQPGLWSALGALMQQLGRPAEAQEAWLEVQRRAPNDAGAAAALALIRQAVAAEPQDPRSKLEAQARRLEASAADPAAAAEVYRKILELDPDSVVTLKKLGAAAANLGLWEEVATVAERLLALADSTSERQEWRARLAQLYAERLNQKDEAARLYLNLLGEGVETAPVVGGLERLASQGVRQADISRALAPVYAQAGDYQRQVASLLVQLSSVHEQAEQKSLLSLLAETSERRLLDERAAFDLRLRGLAIDPADSTFRVEAVRLARALKAQQELTRFFIDLGLKVEDVALAVSLLGEAGAVAAELGAIDDAAAALRAGLERSPTDRPLLAQLADLLQLAKRWSEAEPALRRCLALAPTDERAALWLQLEQVCVELKHPRDAAAALVEALGAGAPELTHLPRLAQRWEEAGQLKELTEVQARLVALYEQAGERDRARALSLERARILETKLGDKPEAIRRYGEVLLAKPADPDALASLENLLDDPDHREAAARALLGAYEVAKDHRKQVSALNVIAQSAKDNLDRITALKQASQLHSTTLRQPEQAFASLATAMRLAVEDPELRQLARAAAEEADALDSYAEVMEELIAEAGTATLALHRELAEVYERKLNQQDAAVRHLHEALKLDGKQAEALKALQRLHRTREEWSELVPIIERLASLEADPAARSALDREAAALSELRLGDCERAALNWRQLAARDVLDKEAASALDRLYTTLDHPHELSFALELRRNQEGQSPLGRELSFRLATLRQDRLADPRGALEVYRQIITDDPSHEGARLALEAWAKKGEGESSAAAAQLLDPVLAFTGDHQRRLEIREARLAQASSPAERARIAQEIRGILERDLNQPQAAFMNALRAFADGVDRAGVQGELERLALATGSFEELAEIYESTAEDAPDGDAQKVALLRRAGELREQLGETEDATRVWTLLLQEAPQDRQALDALSKLYERSQNARSLSDVYARQAALATTPGDRLVLLKKAAVSYEEAGDDASAIDCLKTALAIGRDAEVLRALERLFGRLRRAAEQADVLDQLAGASDAPQEKLGYLLARAAILEREEQWPEALRGYATAMALVPTEPRAIGGLERLLTREVTRHEAARLLEPVYRTGSELKKLVEVLELRLGTVDVQRRVPLMLEIAALREAVGQKSHALATRLRAFAEAPADGPARAELERLAADLGAFEELTLAYEGAIDLAPGEPLTGELWRRVAVIAGERLNRDDLAARAWNEVLARTPKDLSVLDALGRIFRRTSQYRELAIVMRRQLALESAPTVQLNLLFELATLAEQTLSDKAMAAQCYQAVLERKPDDANAVKHLGRILAEMERWPELAALLGREVALAEAGQHEEQALELNVRLARLKLTRLSDPRGALTLLQEVLRRRPAHAGAVGALEEMARSDNALKGEAASTLEPVFANEGDYLKQVQMLEARVGSEPSAGERAQLLRKIAELYSQQIDNVEMAFVAATRALRELPDDPKNLELALLFHKRADAEDEMVTLLAEVAPRAASEAARAALYRALARLQAQHDEEQEAVESWKRVMELAPTDSEAMEQLGQLLARQGRVNELLEVIKRQLNAEEDLGRRVSLLFQLGVLQEEQLQDGAAALTTFRRLLELKPDDVPALVRMERLCEAQQRWPELADAMARRLKFVSDDDRTELMLRLGVVRETRLLDKPRAIDLYTELLALNPTNQDVLSRLEGMVVREPQNQLAVEVLLDAYRRGAQPAKLAQLLEARVGVSPDSVERKALLGELAALRVAQGESELAYLAWYRAYKEDPNDAEVRKQLITTAGSAQAWDELVHALETELPRIGEPAAAAEVAITIAQICETRLSEKERAVVFYEKAREMFGQVGVRVLPALDRLYGELDEPALQADAIEAQAALVTEAQDKVGLNFRLGQLASERLDNPDRAAGAFEKVLECDPRHLPSIRSLEALYEHAKASDKLLRVLELQRELVQGPERERVLTKMATVSSEGLANVDHSISLYRELLDKNARNEQAFEALSVLMDRANRAEDLKDLLTWKLQFTVDPRELVRLNDRLGRVLLERLNRPEDAIGPFKAVLDRDGRHKGAMEALRDIFDRLERRDDLVIVLKRLIPLQETASGGKQIRIRLAELVAQTARREEALDAARRALEVDPHTVEELDRLIAVFTGLKAWPDAVRTLELKSALLQAAEDISGAGQAMFEVADIWRGPANKIENAGAALEKVLEIEPSNRQAYEQARTLYQQLNDWRAYAQVMDRYLPNLVTDDEKVAALREMARVQEHRLGAKHVAFLQFCRAVQLVPADDATREEVERLADETSSYDELAAVYEEIAETVPRGPLAERLYLTLARVQDTKLDDAEAAEVALRHILEFDPTNETALGRLAAMFARRGQSRNYILSLEQTLEAASTLERRKEILREIARVYDEQQEQPDEAEGALIRALELEPDLDTFNLLATLQRRQGNHQAVASTLLRMRDIASTPEERARFQVEVALVHERDLGDDEAAVLGYRQALGVRPCQHRGAGRHGAVVRQAGSAGRAAGGVRAAVGDHV